MCSGLDRQTSRQTPGCHALTAGKCLQCQACLQLDGNHEASSHRQRRQPDNLVRRRRQHDPQLQAGKGRRDCLGCKP